MNRQTEDKQRTNRTHGVIEEYEERSSEADDINEESSSESDYIDCEIVTSDSISTVEHCENAQEIYAEMILKEKAIRFHVDCGDCKKYSIEFVIVKEELIPLLGEKASQHMRLLEIHPENFVRVAGVKQLSCRADKLKTPDQLIKEYQDVFEGDLGTLPGAQRLEVNLRISPNNLYHLPDGYP